MVAMEDGTLIALVQDYEELYNIKHPDYSNHKRRDNIWEEIGEIMKQPYKQCRQRWARIRENYRKALNLRKTKSGQAATKIKAPKFEKELKFLIPYLADEDTHHSNIPSPSTSIVIQENSELLGPLEETYNDQDDAALSNISTPSSCNTSGDGNRLITRKRGAEQPPAAAVLREYSETKKCTTEKAAENQLTNFFIIMAHTVKTFPLRDQIEIKRKLFEMVNSVEMRIATELPESNS